MILTREFSRVAVSYAHLRTMLAGLDDAVDTIGIISAWNPMGEKKSPKYNEMRTKKLRRDIRKGNLGRAISIGGFYFGASEGSLLIPHITREYLLKLCAKYDQDTVIYGEKVQRNGESEMKFEMLERDGQVRMEMAGPVTGKEEPLHGEESIGYSYLRGKTPHPRGKAPRGPEERPGREPKYHGQVMPFQRKEFMIPFRVKKKEK
jgi:hypothetical protein